MKTSSLLTSLALGSSLAIAAPVNSGSNALEARQAGGTFEGILSFISQITGAAVAQQGQGPVRQGDRRNATFIVNTGSSPANQPGQIQTSQGQSQPELQGQAGVEGQIGEFLGRRQSAEAESSAAAEDSAQVGQNTPISEQGIRTLLQAAALPDDFIERTLQAAFALSSGMSASQSSAGQGGQPTPPQGGQTGSPQGSQTGQQNNPGQIRSQITAQVAQGIDQQGVRPQLQAAGLPEDFIESATGAAFEGQAGNQAGPRPSMPGQVGAGNGQQPDPITENVENLIEESLAQAGASVQAEAQAEAQAESGAQAGVGAEV